MSNTSPSKVFLPRRDGRSLDAIKIAAAVLMVVDHTNSLLLGESQSLMFLLGRGVFPIFCYAVAMAIDRKGADRGKDYAWKLLLLALAVEPVSMLVRDNSANVIFTLGLGALVASTIHTWKPFHVVFACLVSAATIFAPHPFEFGLGGALLPGLFLLALRGKNYVWPLIVIVMLTMNLSDMTEALAKDPLDQNIQAAVLTGCAAMFVSAAVIGLGEIFAQTGRYLHRYALHIFYPVHLLTLWMIAKVFAP